MAKENIIQPYSLFGGTGRSVFYNNGATEVVVPNDALMLVLEYTSQADITQTLPKPTLNGTELILKHKGTAGTVKVKPDSAETSIDGLAEFDMKHGEMHRFIFDLGRNAWYLTMSF